MDEVKINSSALQYRPRSVKYGDGTFPLQQLITWDEPDGPLAEFYRGKEKHLADEEQVKGMSWVMKQGLPGGLTDYFTV